MNWLEDPAIWETFNPQPLPKPEPGLLCAGQVVTKNAVVLGIFRAPLDQVKPGEDILG